MSEPTPTPTAETRSAAETETAELLRLVTDHLPAFVSYMGTDGRYKFVNKSFCRWFGKSEKEIEGRTRAEVVGTDVTRYLEPYEEKAFRGQTSRFELTLKKPTGEVVNLDTEYIPHVDPSDGRVRGIIGVGQDVTLRKRAFRQALEARHNAEQSEARYKTLSDAFPNMMWTYAPETGTNYINQRVFDYLGIENAAQFSEAFLKALHPDEVDRVLETWFEGVKSQREFKLEFRIRGHDGKFRWFLSQAQPIYSEEGDIDYWLATSTDIDEQRRIAQELFEAKNAAENANRAKTEFLANMSHEIRTPLGAILGFTDLMRDPSLGPAEREQYAATIARNGRLLTRIIDDILDLAKVESGRMEPEEVAFSLLDLINEVIALFSDSVKQKGIALRFDSDAMETSWVCSDPTRLRQILINIVGNAVKFTEKGAVDISLKTETKGKSVPVTIAVRDTGRGISVQQRNRLFRPFTQADSSTTRRYGGTGLGLALSRRLAEALGGTLELSSSRPGGGSEFVIRIKAKSAHPEERTQDQEHNHPHAALSTSAATKGGLPLEGVRVLLVDDSIDNQSLVRHLLKKMGATVDVANNGREGVAAALAQPHDVVLMDIQMPEMDGYQALAELQHEGFSTPVVALTAHALNEERMRTRAAGFADHLTKPIDKSALLEALTPRQS